MRNRESRDGCDAIGRAGGLKMKVRVMERLWVEFWSKDIMRRAVVLKCEGLN